MDRVDGRVGLGSIITGLVHCRCCCLSTFVNPLQWAHIALRIIGANEKLARVRAQGLG